MYLVYPQVHRSSHLAFILVLLHYCEVYEYNVVHIEKAWRNLSRAARMTQQTIYITVLVCCTTAILVH